MAKHLIARSGWPPPETKAEAFELLFDKGVIGEALRDAFRSAARFRNLVTYQTAIVDDNVVFQILQEHLSDFEAFLGAVARWLEDRGEGLFPEG